MDGLTDEDIKEIRTKKKADVQVKTPYSGPEKLKLSEKIEARINNLSIQQLMDVAEISVADATRRMMIKERNKKNPQQMEFTGYWAEDTTKIYGMKDKLDYDGIITLGIKGGRHSLLSYRMNRGDRRKFAVEICKMMGYKAYKNKHGGYVINIGLK